MDAGADNRRMSEHNVCGDCGSEDLVAVGVFEHATWIYRLTCWTCRDCRSVLAAAEDDVGSSANRREIDGASLSGGRGFLT